MKKRVLSNNILAVFVSIVFLVQISACGTILYPERRGQSSGRIDAGVAVLDGVGLLFFLIPGIIAFAVDFSNGAIYLPGGFSSLTDADEIKVVHVNPDELNEKTIKKIVVRETGISGSIDLGKAETWVLKGATLKQIQLQLTGYTQSNIQTDLDAESFS